MPLDDFDFEDWNYDEQGDPWDYVDEIHLEIGEDGSVHVEIEIDGDVYDFGDFDESSARDLIWDELYWWADEYGIDIDKEISYEGD